MPLPLERIKALREDRAKVIINAQAILEQDKITDEDNQRFDKMMADADKAKLHIDREEKALAAADEMAKPVDKQAHRAGGTPAPESAGGAEEAKKRYADVFRNWMRFGAADLEPDDRALLRKGFKVPEQRAAQSTVTSAGGYLIPQGFSGELTRALKEYGGVRQVARVIPTGTGNQILWPTVNDTANKAVRIAENAAVTETAVTFAQKQLDAYTYRTMVLTSIELLQDSFFSLDTLIPEMLGERLGRGLNEELTTGTGSSQPNGVVTASAAGLTISGNSTIVYNDLVDLEHSVDPAYRRNANFMFNDTALKIIKKLVDSQNRPLWLPGIAVREPDSILGYKYVINQDMAAVGPLAKSILFGDFKYYVVRDAADMLLMRLTERYADSGQVAFILFSRHDGELMTPDATTLNPVKHGVHQSA